MGVRPGTRRPLRPDERALLEKLVRECAHRLLAYVRHAYGPGIDAEEIVAESFCRAAANVGTLQRCDRQDLYLLTIVRNLCRDHFRRGKFSSDEVIADCPAEGGAPGDGLEADERRRALLGAVAALPLAEREVVALRLSEALKFEEIAELLGVPLGTVLSRMHSAVRRLKQNLGGGA